ncbi:MAG: hypothetical protein IAG10_12835 [Planctomycetaceae bacterium]|nr:hypothetical protein [Planctomycetaceae bacterium]
MITIWLQHVVQRSARFCVALCFVALTWLSGCGQSTPPTSPTSSTPPPEPLPPIAAAPVKNAQTDVAYIGTERCAACHRAEETSYHHTAHSRALAEIDLDAEPPDGGFSDPVSQRHYRIYRQDGKLRQEESIRTSAGEPLILCDLPVRYVIGSGRFSRSYLVDRDGCLFVSPVTWYTAPKEWKLSPGYDRGNLGFQRPVLMRCLVCHAGRVESLDRSPQRVALPTLAIDCERCHGPGELHARKWDGVVAGQGTNSGPDETIFNPVHFDRQFGEDVCAQCHLHSAATVERRGRSLFDFRPGRKLSDYLAHYAPQTRETEMKVVGHVEQMRLSRCYQADERMTCLTCHDPHAEKSPSDLKAVYREKCLQCHTDQSCKTTSEARRATAVADDCIQCHMPRSPTEIPHFAFTHHRIGIHKPAPAATATQAAPEELVLIPGSPEAVRFDELRNLGLGYLQFSDATQHASHIPEYRSRAVLLLRQFSDEGGQDSEVDAALARLHWGVDRQQMARSAQAVVDAKDASPLAWTTACFTLGMTYYELRRPAEARLWLERTAALRPTPEIYRMLSECLDVGGETEAAIQAARRACELGPDAPRYCELLIVLLTKAGELAEVETLRPRLAELIQYRRRVDPR